jgi:hypothetical protein
MATPAPIHNPQQQKGPRRGLFDHRRSWEQAVRLVAGAGFEPTTFGL